MYCHMRVGLSEVRSSLSIAQPAAPATPGMAARTWHEAYNFLVTNPGARMHISLFYLEPGRTEPVATGSFDWRPLPFARVTPLTVRLAPAGVLQLQVRYISFLPPVNAAVARPAQRDRLGFEVPTAARRTYEQHSSSNVRKAAERQRALMKLEDMNWHVPRDRKELKKHTRKGVSVGYRAEVWMNACGAKRKMEQQRGLYRRLLDEHRDSTADTIQIEKDLLRTFGTHQAYRAGECVVSLRRVLTAYAWKNSSIGYCQSMNFICGMLLLFLDEEAAFWLLAALVEELLPDYFTRRLIGSKADVLVFKDIVKEKLPRLASHFNRLQYEITIPVTQWFMCLYVGYLPTEVMLRVLDALMLEGNMILFRVGLALLKLNEESILATKTMEECHELLKDICASCHDGDKLMKVAFKELGSLLTTSIADRIRVIRERHLRHLNEQIKRDDLRFLQRHTTFAEPTLEFLLQQFQMATAESTVVDDTLPSAPPPPPQPASATQKDSHDHTSALPQSRFRPVLAQMLQVPVVGAAAVEEREHITEALFRAFDSNRDQVVDFRELVQGAHVLARGVPGERLRWLLRALDAAPDSTATTLTPVDLERVLVVLLVACKQTPPADPPVIDALVTGLRAAGRDGKLTADEARAQVMAHAAQLEHPLLVALSTPDTALGLPPPPLASTATPSPAESAGGTSAGGKDEHEGVRVSPRHRGSFGNFVVSSPRVVRPGSRILTETYIDPKTSDLITKHYMPPQLKQLSNADRAIQSPPRSPKKRQEDSGSPTRALSPKGNRQRGGSEFKSVILTAGNVRQRGVSSPRSDEMSAPAPAPAPASVSAPSSSAALSHVISTLLPAHQQQPAAAAASAPSTTAPSLSSTASSVSPTVLTASASAASSLSLATAFESSEQATTSAQSLSPRSASSITSSAATGATNGSSVLVSRSGAALVRVRTDSTESPLGPTSPFSLPAFATAGPSSALSPPPSPSSRLTRASTSSMIRRERDQITAAAAAAAGDKDKVVPAVSGPESPPAPPAADNREAEKNNVDIANNEKAKEKEKEGEQQQHHHHSHNNKDKEAALGTAVPKVKDSSRNKHRKTRSSSSLLGTINPVRTHSHAHSRPGREALAESSNSAPDETTTHAVPRHPAMPASASTGSLRRSSSSSEIASGSEVVAQPPPRAPRSGSSLHTHKKTSKKNKAES